MEWIFYWAEVLGGLKISLIALSSVFCVIAGLYNIAMRDGYDPNLIPLKWFVIAIISLVIGLFLPCKKTVYIMGGIEIVEHVAANEEVKNISESTLDIINLYLEKTKKELENNNE